MITSEGCTPEVVPTNDLDYVVFDKWNGWTVVIGGRNDSTGAVWVFNSEGALRISVAVSFVSGPAYASGDDWFAVDTGQNWVVFETTSVELPDRISSLPREVTLEGGRDSAGQFPATRGTGDWGFVATTGEWTGVVSERPVMITPGTQSGALLGVSLDRPRIAMAIDSRGPLGSVRLPSDDVNIVSNADSYGWMLLEDPMGFLASRPASGELVRLPGEGWAKSSDHHFLVVEENSVTMFDKSSRRIRRRPVASDHSNAGFVVTRLGALVTLPRRDTSSRPVVYEWERERRELPFTWCRGHLGPVHHGANGTWLFRWARGIRNDECDPGTVLVTPTGDVMDFGPTTGADLSLDGEIALVTSESGAEVVFVPTEEVHLIPGLLSATLLAQ
ncbi:MAG TPA: hypothetical protein RMF84_20080 [Polyangiaceae bacterium LLY-WYZ-14_1]|nr:hypothetical protein [Polyangiaceae bacterium LLY-WYZ-14_1]